MQFNLANLQIHSFAECLLRFLSSLCEPVFPAAIAKKYTKSQNLTEFCNYALALLPTVHFQTFVYLISFLREVIKKQAHLYVPSRNNRAPAKVVDNGDDAPDAEPETIEVLYVQLTLTFSQSLMQVLDADRHDGPRIVLRHFLTSPDFE